MSLVPEIISCENIAKFYDKQTLFESISFDVKKGETIVLCGDNGVGKTTLAKILLGVESYNKGKIKRLDNIKYGYVPQSLSINKEIPITSKKLLELYANNKASNICDLMEQIGISNISDTQLSALSIGQLQKVLIASSIINNPDLLVLDEPLKGLDSKGILSLRTVLSNIKKKLSLSLLIISHQIAEFQDLLDRVFYLDKGNVSIYDKSELRKVPGLTFYNNIQ